MLCYWIIDFFSPFKTQPEYFLPEDSFLCISEHSVPTFLASLPWLIYTSMAVLYWIFFTCLFPPLIGTFLARRLMFSSYCYPYVYHNTQQRLGTQKIGFNKWESSRLLWPMIICCDISFGLHNLEMKLWRKFHVPLVVEGHLTTKNWVCKTTTPRPLIWSGIWCNPGTTLHLSFQRIH